MTEQIKIDFEKIDEQNFAKKYGWIGGQFGMLYTSPLTPLPGGNSVAQWGIEILYLCPKSGTFDLISGDSRKLLLMIVVESRWS